MIGRQIKNVLFGGEKEMYGLNSPRLDQWIYGYNNLRYKIYKDLQGSAGVAHTSSRNSCISQLKIGWSLRCKSFYLVVHKEFLSRFYRRGYKRYFSYDLYARNGYNKFYTFFSKCILLF